MAVETTLTFGRIETAPIRVDEEDSREFLLWPDAVNEWTVGGWDGVKWCDYTGRVMQPLLWALLPLGAAVLASL